MIADGVRGIAMASSMGASLQPGHGAESLAVTVDVSEWMVKSLRQDASASSVIRNFQRVGSTHSLIDDDIHAFHGKAMPAFRLYYSEFSA